MSRLCTWATIFLLIGLWPSAAAGGGIPVCVEPEPPFLTVDDCGGGIHAGIDPKDGRVFVCYENGDCIVDAYIDTGGEIPCTGRTREVLPFDPLDTVWQALERCGLAP